MARRRKTQTASNDVSDFVGEALAGIMERVRDSSENLTGDVAERATKAGSDALKRLSREVERHPLAVVAIAAGIGFLLGMARR